MPTTVPACVSTVIVSMSLKYEQIKWYLAWIDTTRAVATVKKYCVSVCNFSGLSL